MNEREKDIIRLQHIVEAIEAINHFMGNQEFEDFENDIMLQSAVIRQFEIIGEASRNISVTIKEANPDIPWEQIAGLRNMLIHEYFRVDIRTIWESYVHDPTHFQNQSRTPVGSTKRLASIQPHHLTLPIKSKLPISTATPTPATNQVQ